MLRECVGVDIGLESVEVFDEVEAFCVTVEQDRRAESNGISSCLAKF